MKRQYTIYNICVLFALLFLGGGWNDAWGQETTVNIESITASSNQNSVGRLTDGSTWQPWSSSNNDDNPYLILDLGSTQEVNTVNVNFSENQTPDGMTISYSDNGSNNWREISYSGGLSGGVFTLNQTISTQYIRLDFELARFWGQTTPVSISEISLANVEYTIVPQTDKGYTFPQKDIPTLVDTVYVGNGDTRTLITGNYEYYYYFRWYRKNADGTTTTIERIKPTSEGENYLIEVNNAPSYFWGYNIRSITNQSDHIHVASIDYTADYAEGATGEIDSVFCDVSFNIDGWNSQLLNQSSTSCVEPTISKRYKFIIKPASDIKKRLDDFKASPGVNDDTPMQTVRITVPEGATGVNLQMDLDPKSYFWENSQGASFQYSIEGAPYYQDLTSSTKLIRLSYPTVSWDRITWHDYTVNNETTVNVYAIDDGGGATSPCLVRFILTPQTGSSIEVDTNNPNDETEQRDPSSDPDKYKQIGVVDFDFGEAIPYNNSGSITKDNNWRTEPLPYWRTSYGFADPALPWINYWDDNNRAATPEDSYGLYRTANVLGLSDVPYNVQDYYYSKSRFGAKEYGWYVSNTLYDRTYYRTHANNAVQDSCGYFFYMNASQEAGRIVTVPIDGTICANTELIITAWVADMSDAATPPNVSLIFRGEKENRESVVLHHFSSGNISGADGQWNQIYYKITVTDDILDYANYSLDIHNNTPDSHGADYAIDDIRIYRTLPNIEVYRENACDAATLIVSTDYETILRNMGWTERQEVAREWDDNTQTGYNYNDLETRKYRYGLMGADHEYLNSVVGNVYFAFMNETKTEWISVNNAILEKHPGLDKVAKVMRVAVSTVMSKGDGTTGSGYEFFTESRDDAMTNERRINYRAVLDYNTDFHSWNTKDAETHSAVIPTDNINPDDPSFDEAAYQAAILELYSRLGIPRLRCPWYYEEGNEPNKTRKLYLGIIDVDNTDLHYQDEPIPGSENETYSGDYWVMTFSAAQIVNGGEGAIEDIADIDDCTLMSPFTVQPATTITVETMTDATTALCQGAVRKITPTLNVYDPDTNEPVENFETYIFDWYLGPEEEFKALVFGDNNETLDVVLQKYRNRDNRNPDRDEIDPDAFVDWVDSQYGRNEAGTIRGLFNDNKLLTGTQGGETLIIQITSEDYIAMPYVYEQENNYVYCTDWTRVHFDITGNDIPDFYVGLRLAERPVALRLGLRHLEDGHELTIPVSKALQMAEGVDHFGLAESNGPTANPVYVVINGVYTQIGQLTALNVPRPAKNDGAVTNATLTIQWHKEALEYLHEGEQYILRIPFVQVDEEDNVLASQCDGWAYFPVKVVPEYLTWKGGSTDSWYDESKWNQSTKEELYFEGWNGADADEDANGPDEEGNYENIEDAFSPLYFTKITIPGGKELALKELSTTTIGNYQFLNEWASDNSDSIRYEMAVVDETGNILPYYINNVDQIYFKPNASLYRQDYLTYKKAWVDFEMEEGKPYWMSAPLQNVYAGDMYAPSNNGRQETAVFGDGITFAGKNEVAAGTATTETNSRWSPAFYQKAWDKAIAYVSSGTTHDKSNATDVAAVKSNWSIEYNDVWVPYGKGKGFYARVEDLPGGSTSALVRLPKADTEYSYEASTKAGDNLSNVPTAEAVRANAHSLMDKGTDGSTGNNITIYLSDDKDADGDGKHFLIGNPYMGYLDMKAFFAENSDVLEENKFWTLDRENGSIVVGTPDVTDWGNGKTTGYVAPMTAFFVELKDDVTDKEVTFMTSMIAQKPTTTDNVYTKSFAATNPTLTITAERGETRSVAKLLTSDKAENGYRASEDAVVLLDSELDAPMVYTVAGSRAAQVNAVKKISNIGLGVYNAGDDEATLTISGISRMATPLYLYDAATRQSTRLEGDSYELRVSGDSHGRYFLRDAELGDELENTISIYSARPGEVIVSSLRPVKDIRVFALNGSQVRRFSVNTTRYTFTLPAGIYLIQATDGERGQTEKVLVR